MKKEIKERFGKKYYLLGVNQDNEKVWLEQGHFDCDWYWGVGYVEIFNKYYTDIEMHSHFDSMFLQKNIYNSYIDYFKEITLQKNEVWQLLELMQTIYTLRKTSDMIHSKGSHITSNEKEKEIFNNEYYNILYKRINDEEIPALLKEVYALLGEESEEK